MTDERTIEARIYERLSKVIDPELGRSVTDLGMIAAIDAIPVEGKANTYEVRVEVELTVEGCPLSQTITNQINGAVAIFLPGVAKRLGEMMGNDLYIAFTSMHEAAIHNCEKVYPETIRESLKDLNREMPSDDDFLSEKVYYYNRGKDRIEVVLEY